MQYDLEIGFREINRLESLVITFHGCQKSVMEQIFKFVVFLKFTKS